MPTPRLGVPTDLVSFPGQPQMYGGKGRKENRQVHHMLCLTENAGLPVPGEVKKRKSTALDGNGVTIVPNVHAVMAWAARKTLAVNEV